MRLRGGHSSTFLPASRGVFPDIPVDSEPVTGPVSEPEQKAMSIHEIVRLPRKSNAERTGMGRPRCIGEFDENFFAFDEDADGKTTALIMNSVTRCPRRQAQSSGRVRRTAADRARDDCLDLASFPIGFGCLVSDLACRVRAAITNLPREARAQPTRAPFHAAMLPDACPRRHSLRALPCSTL